MDTGKKIKILRNNLKMTGKELSEITGINHGIIRKYESTNCNPQYSHILKIASALKVRPYVLSDKNYDFQFETYSDIYGLFIYLYKINFITFKKTNDIIMLELNPKLEKIIQFRIGTDAYDFVTVNMLFENTIKSHNLYPIFVQWISNTINMEKFKKSVNGNLNDIALLEEQNMALELQLQQCIEKL